ncbi:MAG: hypothetical protein M2R45_04161 [Verrucomicrobia subdivision 3 bacterium]|nr:hypothetical protein [Limisphaerales bacterium]
MPNKATPLQITSLDNHTVIHTQGDRIKFSSRNLGDGTEIPRHVQLSVRVPTPDNHRAVRSQCQGMIGRCLNLNHVRQSIRHRGLGCFSRCQRSTEAGAQDN